MLPQVEWCLESRCLSGRLLIFKCRAKLQEPLSLAEELLERELNQAPAESLTGALWERVAGSEAVDSPFKLNDVRKARSANKFVGDGCAGEAADVAMTCHAVAAGRTHTC